MLFRLHARIALLPITLWSSLEEDSRVGFGFFLVRWWLYLHTDIVITSVVVTVLIFI